MLTAKKLSLKFPDYNSLWLFKAKTKAINVRIEPRKNIITGLFEPAEIEMAVKEFNAVQPTLSFPSFQGYP
jgi:hypothetical protein